MANSSPTDRLPGRTKLLYGIGDAGNATINSALQFFLMVFYTDGALIAPGLAGSALLIGEICGGDWLTTAWAPDGDWNEDCIR